MTLLHGNRNVRTVWELYNATIPDVYGVYRNPARCLYCDTNMRAAQALLQDGHPRSGTDKEYVNFALCDCCGWWSARRCLEDGQAYMLSASSMDELSTQDSVLAACGTLAELSSSDLTTASLEDVRKYLVAKKSALTEISPQRTEELVTAAYRNAGYRAEHVGRTGDNGIDVILMGNGNDLVGVQVKRYGNRVGVEEIREFVGALYVEDFVRGIFVTTSSFTRGAKDYTRRLMHKRALPIELVDGDSLLALLRVARDGNPLAIETHPAMRAIVSGTARMTKVLEARNSWGSFSNLRVLLDAEMRAVSPEGDDASKFPVESISPPES